MLEFVLAAILASLPAASEKRVKRAQRHGPLIVEAAERYSVPQLVLVAQIKNESGWRVFVKGKDGLDLGLLQLRRGGGCLDGFEHMTDRELMKPRRNIFLGARCLAKFIKRCGSLEAGLSRYNGRGCRKDTFYSRKILRIVDALEDATFDLNDRRLALASD